MDRIAPSIRLEAQIAELLGDELAANAEKLAELGRLGARLVLQRAVEDEGTAVLGRARYHRTGDASGSRNGTRPKSVQTAESELAIDMPQVRGAAERFISRVFPDSRTVIRTRPLEALIIGGYVRGLSDRDIESLMEEAGLGQVSKSTASRICRELRARPRKESSIRLRPRTMWRLAVSHGMPIGCAKVPVTGRSSSTSMSSTEVERIVETHELTGGERPDDWGDQRVFSISGLRTSSVAQSNNAWMVLIKSESDVAACVGQGLTNDQIASTLTITPETVAKHLEHIFRKLDFNNARD